MTLWWSRWLRSAWAVIRTRRSSGPSSSRCWRWTRPVRASCSWSIRWTNRWPATISWAKGSCFRPATPATSVRASPNWWPIIITCCLPGLYLFWASEGIFFSLMQSNLVSFIEVFFLLFTFDSIVYYCYYSFSIFIITIIIFND